MADIYAKRVKAANKLAARKERIDAKADRLAAKTARALRKSDVRATTDLEGASAAQSFGALSYQDVSKIIEEVGLQSHAGFSAAVALEQKLALRQRRADFAQLGHEYIDHFQEAVAEQNDAWQHDGQHQRQPGPLGRRPRPLTVVVDLESVLAGRHRQSWATDPSELIAALSNFRAGASFTEDDRMLLLLPDSLAARQSKKAARLPVGAAGISLVLQERLTDAVERLMAEEGSSTAVVGVTSNRTDAVQLVRQGAAVMRSNRLVALVTEGASADRAAGGRRTRADKAKSKHQRGGRGPRCSTVTGESARM